MNMKNQGDDWFEKIPIDNPMNPQMPPWLKKGIGPIIIAVILLFGLMIFRPWVTVEPDEAGVVLFLGNYDRTLPPGFHFRLPPPIEIVVTPRVTEIKKVEIGFRSNETGRGTRNVAEESTMLTGDENIIVSNLIVQYQISDPVAFLFNVADVEATLKDIAEAAERQVIGDYAIDAALTWGRSEVQEQIERRIQEICDSYDMGIRIIDALLQATSPPEQVESAFSDVISAREDQVRFVNQADGYRNSEIPKAEGQARQLLEQAEAYRQERVNKAKGEVERFHVLLQEYKRSPEVTRSRLYLEMLQEVLPGKNKVIMNDSENGQSNDVLKFMNLSPGANPLLPSTPSTTNRGGNN